MHHVGCMAALNPTWFRATVLLKLIMFYVYVLRSLKDGKFYIGYSSNLKLRFTAHNNGECISTKHRRPFELIFYEAFKSRRDAERRELYFKTSKGKSSLRMMLREYLYNPNKENQ